MKRKALNEIEGLCYEWLASDADGHPACFSTAGGGYAPAEFLEDTDAHDLAIDMILAAPPSTVALFAPPVSPELTNTWQLMAERGVFAFESDYIGGPYTLVAAPKIPTHLRYLPTSVSAIIARVTFSTLCFSSISEIPEELIRNRG
jgi:hypothetical protein